MISTIADLLDAFRQKERQLLDKQNISHPPTIGQMYEGLTRTVLERTFPEGLDLRVVSGFIINDKGESSKQIDCMLVSGEGEPVPYTNDYKYHFKDVIAVIEVKKNLYSNELDNAYQNLMSVRKLLQPNVFPENRLFNDAHRSILRTDPDVFEDIYKLPVWQFQLSLALFVESVTPIRIVLGYHGFSSEIGFRNAFINYLENNPFVRSYGAADFPNLIISGEYSLIKLNGMPYSLPVNNQTALYAGYGMRNLAEEAPEKKDLWPLYASYAGNPMVLMLELIWTRLTYEKQISLFGFDSDLNVEILKLLLLAKAVERNGEVGWYYEHFYMPPEILDRIPMMDSWQPIELNEGEHIALTIIILMENSGVTDGVDINSSQLIREFEDSAYPLEDSVKNLYKAGLISIENGKLRLLTRECSIAVLPDGRFVAGENSSGRFSNWLEKYQKDFDSKKEGKSA